MFLFASRTDTFGQVILEAQASGLPVVAVAEGGPALADRARRDRAAGAGRRRRRSPTRCWRWSLTPLLRERLRRAALAAVRERTWEASLERLAAGYRLALRAARRSASDRSVA